ncbi:MULTISPECIES: hypothetical protein [unclassified Rhizobacter]|uniref:hypothetical protein n=1 Tax=unclassified Rhizobacter TaxID=2640088 RepID=UPI000B02060F|nr:MULTISPECIES: hypothetical protein [unclassified Rhizobacter]
MLDGCVKHRRTGAAAGLWAQWREEDNLYLSAGFMCGSCALVHADYASGMAGMVAGAVAMLLLRSRKREFSPRRT